MKKRWVSFLLVLALLLSCVSSYAMAVETAETGYEATEASYTESVINSDVEAYEGEHCYYVDVGENNFVFGIIDDPSDRHYYTDFAVNQIAVRNGMLYMSAGQSVYCMDVQTEEKRELVVADSEILRFAIADNRFYYLTEGVLYCMDLESAVTEVVVEETGMNRFWLEDSNTIAYMVYDEYINYYDLTTKIAIVRDNKISVLDDTIVASGETGAKKGLTASSLREKFPHGKYWNRVTPGSSTKNNNQDGWTNTACPDHSGTIGTANQTCNGFMPGNAELSWQCMGYAEKCAYDVTGSNPRVNANGWQTYENASALDNLKAGDIVRYTTSYLHSIYVTAVNGDTVTFTDCNWIGKCQIRWDGTISKSTLKSRFVHLRSAPSALPTVNHQPVIVLDECSSPSTGVLRVKGWAYDPDSPNEPVNVHVYFGEECVYGELYTGVYRPDVPAEGHPCGPNQGFEADLFTWEKYGTKEVSVYAINIGAGHDYTKATNTPTITVARDTTAPSLYNPTVTNITSSSYEVAVDTKDDVHVLEVKMPSWVTGQTGNDAVWHLATRNGETDRWSCTIPRVAGKTTHWTHVYSYDLAGNSTCGEIRLDDVNVTFNANGGTCSTGSKKLTSITAFENYINPYGTLPTPTRSGYSFAGWYTAASGGTKVTASTMISNRSNHTLYAHWTQNTYLLDLQGEFSGEIRETIDWIGTVDVYINGVLVADDVIDYNARHPAGTKYEIKDIRVKKNISYNGIYSGNRVGTMGAQDTTVCLSYNRIKPENFTEEPRVTMALDGHVYEFYDTPVTWYTARYICEYKGGYLVAITSEKEYETLATYFKDHCMWIGATDEEKEGTFTWPTGEPFVYSNWYAGEPGNSSGDEDNRESYVAMRPGGQQWSDFNGTRTFGFICEYESCTHKYEDTTVEPTCISQGYILHTCTVCGHSYKDSYTEVTNHSYTYENKGEIHEAVCGVCGNSVTEVHSLIYSEVDESNHTGICSCGYTTSGAHNWSLYSNSIFAGCDHDGLSSYICSECNAFKWVNIPAYGHRYNYTDMGEYHEAVCNKCRYKFTEAHSYVDGACVTCGAEEVIRGTLEPLTWAYYVVQNKLVISGEGAMQSYSDPDSYPWATYGAKIKNLVIEDGVSNISGYSFYYFSGLENVTIGRQVTAIGDYAFLGCAGLSSVAIPDGVKTIGDFAFIFCSGLTDVVIPNSVSDIGEGVFASCEKLTAITVGEDHPYYSNDDRGVLFNKDKTTLVACPSGMEGSYVIPDTVTAVGDSGFYYCTKLTDVTLPDGLTTIGVRGFTRCNELTAVTIPGGVREIGSSAFRYCGSMDHVHFIGNMPTMGTNAFANGSADLKLCYLEGTEGWEACTYTAEPWDHTYTVDGTWITYTCNLCGKVYSCDGGVVVPITDESIVINHTLNLASDISVSYAVKAQLLEAYEDYYLEIKLPVYEGNKKTGEETVQVEPVVSGSYIYFTLTGVTAVQMNDELTATVHMTKGGKNYVSKEDLYSIAIYAYNQLNKSSAPQSLKKLCADLLCYGAATQSYKGYRTDALVTENMTEVHKAYMSNTDGVTFGNTNTVYNDISSPLITWVGKTLNLDSKVIVRFIFDATAYTGNISNLTLKLVYEDSDGIYQKATVKNPTVYNAARCQYAFDFDGLMAAELRTAVSVAVYAGDVQVSQTLRYSPDTYGNNKNGALLTVCKALFAYSDSAKAYFAF